MPVHTSNRKIAWYRSPVERSLMTSLIQRNDLQAWILTIGTYGSLLITGAAAWYAWGRLPWYLVVLLFFLHGTLMAFQINALHEYVHKTVFRSRKLNDFFLFLSGFLSWTSPVFFWASHQEHHKWTLHPPEDLEVTLPSPASVKQWLTIGFLNPLGLWGILRQHIRFAQGKTVGDWETHLFPPGDQAAMQPLARWSRVHLLGHLLIIIIGIAFNLPQLPLLITFAPFYGGALQYLINNTQHSGLIDNVPDYRLSTRTLTLNPLLSFYYWRMEYHTEHHMFAAVPCYNLRRLHEAIRDDLAVRPGLIASLKEILAIQKRQAADPQYRFIADLPATANPYVFPPAAEPAG